MNGNINASETNGNTVIKIRKIVTIYCLEISW